MITNKNKRIKKIIGILATIIISIPIVIIPVATVVIYEAIFGMRYETLPWLWFDVEDYDGLKMEQSDFESNGVMLAGYKYFKDISDSKGVVVISHGLGGGGHNTYMPFVDYFTSNGYYVFTYDARGNDNSEGKSVEGFPQGIIDLDNAISHMSDIEEYENLPIFLLGHSWGGYSVGNVLCLHPEVKAAVIISGFNESENLLQYYSEKVIGDSIIDFLLLYVDMYEQIKFGKEYTEITAVSGMKNTEAAVMIVHSKDDTIVPTRYGYDNLYKEFSDSERVEFVLYEEKGHGFLYYSDEAIAYQEQLKKEYYDLVEEQNRDNEYYKEQFMDNYTNKEKCFELDPMLMNRILEMFENTE